MGASIWNSRLAGIAAVAVACLWISSQHADAQDAAAQQLYQRALQLYEGNNYAAALPLLTQSARAGEPRAAALIGIMYQDGQGVPPSDAASVPWFEMAAARGHRASQYALGSLYAEGGGGLHQDSRRAAELYLASARQGFYKAQIALGLAFEFGDGVWRDRRTAIYWLDQAAAQGEGHAHWIADWLRRPDTPKFRNADQLANYIGAQMMKYYARAGAANSPCSNPVSCTTAMDIMTGRLRTNGGGGDIQGPHP